MFQRLRRPSTLLLAVLLPAALTLAACGSDESGPEELAGLKAVSVTGDVGASPKLDWKGILKPDAIASQVLTEGDGPELAEGDRVQVEWSLINGYTHDVLWDTYDEDRLSTVVKVGTAIEPTNVNEVLASILASEIKAGQKLGSRIAVTVGSDRVIGAYGDNTQALLLFAQLGIGNQDGLLFIGDLAAPAAPDGKAAQTPAWAPKIVEKDGVPKSLDFAKAATPSGSLRVATLVQGTGPKVAKGQQILASYLGQTRDKKKPFDENFSKSGALQAVVGGKAATVVKGWSQGLVGQRVGSRVLLEIPPSLGYGKKPQKDQDGKVTIPGNSTLYFVVDILDVSDVEPAPVPETAPPSEPSDQEPGAEQTQ